MGSVMVKYVFRNVWVDWFRLRTYFPFQLWVCELHVSFFLLVIQVLMLTSTFLCIFVLPVWMSTSMAIWLSKWSVVSDSCSGIISLALWVYSSWIMRLVRSALCNAALATIYSASKGMSAIVGCFWYVQYVSHLYISCINPMGFSIFSLSVLFICITV